MKKRYILSIVMMVGGLAFSGLLEGRDFYYRDPLKSYFGPAAQQLLFEGYENSGEAGIRARNAFLLSRLWREGRLENEIKDHLVDKYYRIVLVQGGNEYGSPNFAVQSQQSFPFPSNWVRFTPKMYRNGKVEWAPEKPQTEHAMCQNSSMITSHTGGAFQRSPSWLNHIRTIPIAHSYFAVEVAGRLAVWAHRWYGP